MAKLRSGTTIGGSAAWHAGNDGSGSGLDADLLDGNHASAFATSGHTHNLTIGNGSATQITYTSAETLNIVAGTNVSISYDDSTNKVTINSSYTNTDTLQSISDDTSTNATYYPSFVTATTGALTGKVSSSKLTFNPSTGNLLATRLESNVTTGTAPLTVASTTVVSNLNADLLDGNHASAFALSGHTHSYYIGTTAVQTSSADQALTGITSITGGGSNLIVKTADNVTAGSFSRGVLIRTGNATGGSGSFAGDILIAPGTSDESAAQTVIKGGESASGNNGAGGGGHLTLLGGANSSAVTSGIISAGNVYLTGGVVSNTSTGVTKYTGSVYIDGGGSGSGGTINYGTVNIGGNSGGNLYGTSAVNIGTSAIATTINGTVKLPNVGTSGFVKLGTGGQLSADTNTYLQLSGGTMTGAITFAAGQTWPTFNQSTTGNAATATTSTQLGGLTKSQLWNNSGQNHSQYTDFSTPADFGEWFIQQDTYTDGPSSINVGGPNTGQYYSRSVGLGSDYAYSNYGMQQAIGRNVLQPYHWVRYREAGTWQTWTKVAAGYADTAGSATTADQIDGVAFRNSGSGGPVNASTLDSNGITYYTSGVDNFSGNATDGALYSQVYSSSWQHQIAGDYREGNIAVRGKNNGTWARWKPIPTLTISDSAPANETKGDMWWESDTGKLKIYYDDGTSSQWVDAVPIPDTSNFYSKAGGAISGPVVASSSITATGKIFADGSLNSAAANGSAQIYLTGSLNGATNQGAGLYFSDNADNNLAIKTLYTGGTGNYITINPGNTEVVRVKQNGTVGIGADPSYKLHVAGNAHVQDYLRITNTSGTQRLVMGNQDSNGANNPTLIGSANGSAYFGNGNSWTNDGGTATWHSSFNSTGLGLGLGTTGANYRLHVNGTGYATTDFRAPIFYDSADTSFYCDPNSTTRLYHLQVDKGSASDRDKIRLWTDSNYAIGMQNGITYGGLENDWGMTFQFNNADSRGFWWGDSAHSTAQGAMALTTNGKLTVAHSVRVGFGEDDVSIPGSTYRLEVNGSFAATSKSFLIDHPTKHGKKLRHGSLEGPEHGVYVRGRLKGNVIELPEYWTKLVDSDSITVQLTAVGKNQQLYVDDIRDNKVFVANANDEEVNCFYLVQAERVDVEKMEVEID